MSKKIIVGIGLILFSVLVAVIFYYFKLYSYKSISSDGVFSYIGNADSNKLDSAAIEGYKVKVNTKSFRKDNTIKFNLPDGINYEVTKDHTDPSILESDFANKPGQFSIINDFTWFGKITKPNSLSDTVFIHVRGDNISGNIPSIYGFNKFLYSISKGDNDSYHLLQKIDPSKFGRD